MPMCKGCGIPLEKPFKYCGECSALRSKKKDRMSRELTAALHRTMEEARRSGNPKTYTSAEHTQEFLQSLIPRRF